jgi:hypothetical protein
MPPPPSFWKCIASEMGEVFSAVLFRFGHISPGVWRDSTALPLCVAGRVIFF